MKRPRHGRGAFYLPEAATILGVPLRTIQYWLYHPLYRHCLSHLTARNGKHPRRLRLLTTSDIDTLAHLMLLRSTKLLHRPKLQIRLEPASLSSQNAPDAHTPALSPSGKSRSAS